MGLEITRGSGRGIAGVADLIDGLVSDGVCGGVVLITSIGGLGVSGCGTGGGTWRVLGGVCGGVVLVASLAGLAVSFNTARLMLDPLRS